MAHWEKAGKLSEFRNGCQWQVKIQNRPVALFKYENNFYYGAADPRRPGSGAVSVSP